MSTSVSYLIGIGVLRRELGGILTRYPEILGMRAGRVIKPYVEYLGSLRFPKIVVATLVEKKPPYTRFSLEEQVMPNIAALMSFGVKDESMASIITQFLERLGMELELLLSQRNLFESNMLADRDEFCKIVEKMSRAIGALLNSSYEQHLNHTRAATVTPEPHPSYKRVKSSPQGAASLEKRSAWTPDASIPEGSIEPAPSRVDKIYQVATVARFSPLLFPPLFRLLAGRRPEIVLQGRPRLFPRLYTPLLLSTVEKRSTLLAVLATLLETTSTTRLFCREVQLTAGLPAPRFCRKT
ncbi:hypothetical protein KSP39_PZI006167 [Platanthera zijinensis]|uniref:Uncharacterized protein n=1 Tax=Platanthera zijinensis TaxID=2320716 RepID=A0AAP0GAA5_9ASPA